MEIFYFGENKGHKAGCLNAVYSALKKITLHYKMTDDDIIIFSHDDIYLSNKNKLESHLKFMYKFDFIGRRCIRNKHVPSNCDYYVMMESFIIKPSFARKLTENYSYNMFNDSDLLLDGLKSTSPEMNFGKDIINNTNNYYFISINENAFGENDMGYFHIKNIRGQGEL